uniref:Major facilitator superfamily (MFS) profile domain-containing protein n=1 Tax=Panagrolaimus superbus TaxID=310955 RepID=A0A914Z844_9BILA
MEESTAVTETPTDVNDTCSSAEEYQTSEDVLTKLGWKNFKLCYVIVLLSFVWGLIALSIMSTDFVVHGIQCLPNLNDSKCEEDSIKFNSINKEFDLDPDSLYSGDLFLTVYFLGNMLVGTFLSLLADIIGRRYIVIGSLLGLGIFGVGCSFCTSFPLLLAIRFLQGCFFTPGMIVTWVLASECISISYHAAASTFFTLLWVVGYCIVPGVAYFLPDWSHIMLAISIPSILFAFILLFTIPESFHFLIDKKKEKAAQKWVEKFETEKKKLDCNAAQLIERIDAKEKLEGEKSKTNCSASLQFLWDHKKYICFLFALTLLWIIDLLIYNSVSLLSTHLSNNPYLSFLYSGIAEMPACFILPLAVNWIGSNETAYTILWLLGKLGISICMNSLFVYGAEIFPPIIRSTCLGTASFFGNIGGMIPFQTNTFLAQLHPIVPVAFYSFLSLVGGAITFALPK